MQGRQGIAAAWQVVSGGYPGRRLVCSRASSIGLRCRFCEVHRRHWMHGGTQTIRFWGLQHVHWCEGSCCWFAAAKQVGLRCSQGFARSTGGEPWKPCLFFLTAGPGIRLSGDRVKLVAPCLPRCLVRSHALEKPKDRPLVVLITASGLQGLLPLVDRAK